MRMRARVLVAALAAAAALGVPHSAAHASCTGYGGQGVGGYVSSLVTNCVDPLIH